MRHKKGDVSVDFRSSRVHADSGDTDDVRRARIVSGILIREGEQGAGQPLDDVCVPGEPLSAATASAVFVPNCPEPNQDAIIPDVEAEIGSDRCLNHRAVVERYPFGPADWRLAVSGAASPRLSNALIICPIDLSTNLMALRPGLGVAAGSR